MVSCCSSVIVRFCATLICKSSLSPDADADKWLDGELISRAEEALLSEEDTLQRAEWRTDYGNIFAWLALRRNSGSGEPADGDPVLICMEFSIDMETIHIVRDFLEDILPLIIALGVAFLVLLVLFRKKSPHRSA